MMLSNEIVTLQYPLWRRTDQHVSIVECDGQWPASGQLPSQLSLQLGRQPVQGERWGRPGASLLQTWGKFGVRLMRSWVRNLRLTILTHLSVVLPLFLLQQDLCSSLSSECRYLFDLRTCWSL